jgi:hypothetical protein
MTRPKRLYLNSKGKYYYIIDGKKKYIKVPATMSQKQVQNINIKNIIGTTARRLKRRKKKVEPRYQQRIVPNMVENSQSGLPSYIFRPSKSFTSISELTTKAEDTSEKKLIDLFLKGATQVKSESGKIGTPKIESALKKGEKINTVYEEAMEFIKENKVKSEPVSIPTGKNLMSEFNKSALPTPLSNTPAPKTVFTVPPSTSTEYAPKLKKLREDQKQRKEKEKEKVLPSTASLKKLPVQERRDLGIEKIKFYSDKAKRLSQVLINEGIIKINKKIKNIASSIPTTLEEWNALGRDVGLIDRDYDSFNDVINAISDNLPPEMRKMVGSGDGLYNDQIEQIMKKRINNFVPVVAKDQVDSLLGYVKKGDKFFSAVVNTDPSSGGRHWRCIVMDNRDDFPSAEYFDPLCETMKPEESLLNVMREISKKMNPEKYFKYKFSEIRRQSFNKSNCGYHVCKYIEDRYNGVPFSEASGYDDYEKRMKGTGAPDNSADGEKELKNYEKMIKKKFSEFL